ncbi:GumC family protein [Pirellulaceae bacterium SH501]
MSNSPSQSTRSRKRVDFVDFCNLESFFRYKGTAFIVFCGGLIATFAFLWIRDRSFDSNARVFIRIGRESVTVDPTASASGQVLQLNESQKREIQSAIDILQSEEMIAKLVDEAGPEVILGKSDDTEDSELSNETLQKLMAYADQAGDYLAYMRKTLSELRILEPSNPRAKAITKLQKQIKVKAEADSNVLSLRVRTESPELSQQLAVSMLDRFQVLHLKAHRSPGAVSFFTDQLGQTRTSIETLAKELSRAKNDTSITSIQDQRAVLTEKLKSLELATLASRGEEEATLAKSNNLEEASQEVPERLLTSEVVGLTNTSKDDMRSKLYTLQLELADLTSQYLPTHPLVVKKAKQVEEASSVLETENTAPQKTTATNPAREALRIQQLLSKADNAGAKARSSEMETQREKLQREIRLLNEREAEIESIERELSVMTSKFRKYAESLEESRIDEALQTERLSSINIIQPPTLDDAPVDVSNTLVSAAGLFLSCLAAIGSTFARRYWRNDLLTPADFERELRLPILETLHSDREHTLQSV